MEMGLGGRVGGVVVGTGGRVRTVALELEVGAELVVHGSSFWKTVFELEHNCFLNQIIVGGRIRYL